MVNDDDSLDDECLSDFDAVEESEKLPPDISSLSKEELCQVVDEEIKKICQHPAQYLSERQQAKQIYIGDSDDGEPSGSGGKDSDLNRSSGRSETVDMEADVENLKQNKKSNRKPNKSLGTRGRFLALL